MGRGNPEAGEIGDVVLRSIREHGCRQPAAPVAKGPHDRQVTVGLRQQVAAGDPEVRHAITDELDDVVRPDEQDVERHVLHVADQASVALLEEEAGVVEQRERGLHEASFVGDCERHSARGAADSGHRAAPDDSTGAPGCSLAPGCDAAATSAPWRMRSSRIR